jgi:excisionase family DNA binding protein
MAKTYNKDKHFDADYFRTKGLAFFDTLDFSDIDNEEMRKNYTLQSRAIERLEEKIRQKQSRESNLLDDKPEIKQSSNLLTTEEAAKYLKLKPNTLERWRTQYPDRLPFVKIGRTVKYRLEDLQAYVSDNRKS